MAASFDVRPAGEDEPPGAHACFPYDRALVERFREAFPRARWRGEAGCWFVPGVRAAARVDAWMARELAALDRHGDEKGRDAHGFDPLPSSPYLQAGDELVVRTPYSRTVVEILRAIPWARWDSEARVWRVPYRSYEALRRRWPEIEDAARRNEPEERRRRAEARRDDPAAAEQARAGARERRRRRLPVPLSDPPPLGVPIATAPYGVVVFEATDAEALDPADLPALYGPPPGEVGPLAWAHWRPPSWRELAAARPAPEEPDAAGRRGWWPPTRAELHETRRAMRRFGRTRGARAASGPPPGRPEAGGEA